MKRFSKQFRVGALALALLLSRAQATTVSTVHSFNSETTCSSRLVQGADGNLYGTTDNSGTNSIGTVYRMTTTGTLSTLYSFAGGTAGSAPNYLIKGSDGNFYGATAGGGANSAGTIFKLTSGGTLTTLYSFAMSPEGIAPVATLVQGSDGNLYGTTKDDGANADGTVFKITTGGAMTLLYTFGSTTDADGEPLDGADPSALIQATDGNFYGTTVAGGTNGEGTIFKITASGTFTTLYSFPGGPNGSGPSAELFQGTDGNLYGATSSDGANGFGTIFKITTSGVLTTLYSFTGATDGTGSNVTLLQASDGNYYGTTQVGGSSANSDGSIFRMTPGGTFTTLYSFTGGSDQANYRNTLMKASDGNLYGTSRVAGTSGHAIGFKCTTGGTVTTLCNFPSNDGSFPFAGLVLGTDGNFYGSTTDDGPNDYGVIFKCSPTGAFTVLYAFGTAKDTDGNILDGVIPNSLAQGTDGNFYGTTMEGGVDGNGTFFRITPAGVFTVLYTFTGTGGSLPWDRLVQGSDGYLYGTTELGGTNGFGTVFKVSTSGAFTSLYSFTGTTDGAYPTTGLTLGNDGNFYGPVEEGGATDFGAIYKITSGGAFSLLYSFTGGVDGAFPANALAKGLDGNFYGTVADGGANDFGNVFKITPTGTLTTLYSFTGGADGNYPNGGLVQSGDGNFFGTTVAGGANGLGNVFSITPSGGFTNLYSFTGGNDGSYPSLALTIRGYGELWGVTETGGLVGSGTLFQVNTTTRIMNRNSGKALNVDAASTSDGAHIIQWPYTASNPTNDEWNIIDIGGGYCKILSRNSGKALNVEGASTLDGAYVIQWTYTSNAPTNDEWQIVNLGGGYCKILNRNSGKALNVEGISTADGARVIQWPYTANQYTNDEWQIIATP